MRDGRRKGRLERPLLSHGPSDVPGTSTQYPVLTTYCTETLCLLAAGARCDWLTPESPPAVDWPGGTAV